MPSVATALTFSPEKLANFLDAVPKARLWLDKIEELAFHQARKGVKIPRYKLVQKRGTRRWTDARRAETKAKFLFGSDALEPAYLKTPAQLEKISGQAKKFVKKWSTSVSSGLTLVGDADPRPATSSAAADFSDE